MFLRSRAPSRLALCLEKCFHHEQAAGRDQLKDSWHAGSVKIIEYQNRIKSPQRGPDTREIQLPPLDGESLCSGQLRRGLELDRVAVDPDDSGTQFRSGKRVAGTAAGEINHPGTWLDPMSVPEKPGAGPHSRRSLERPGIPELAAQ